MGFYKGKVKKLSCFYNNNIINLLIFFICHFLKIHGNSKLIRDFKICHTTLLKIKRKLFRFEINLS